MVGLLLVLKIGWMRSDIGWRKKDRGKMVYISVASSISVPCGWYRITNSIGSVVVISRVFRIHLCSSMFSSSTITRNRVGTPHFEVGCQLCGSKHLSRFCNWRSKLSVCLVGRVTGRFQLDQNPCQIYRTLKTLECASNCTHITFWARRRLSRE